jgi:kynurenine formamidase
MFMFLSHILDPDGYAWPGEPVVSTQQCTDVCEETPFCSFVSTVPNHCGTHMDAPRHFVKDGISINELPIEYFWHTEVALL